MFQHIGITIHTQDDIETFYKGVLGLEEVRRFQVDPDLSERLFGIRRQVSVAVLSRDDFRVELFLSDERQHGVYNHIGIAVPDPQAAMKKAEMHGFEVTCIERESKNDLLFIRDHSGNTFEIKGS